MGSRIPYSMTYLATGLPLERPTFQSGSLHELLRSKTPLITYPAAAEDSAIPTAPNKNLFSLKNDIAIPITTNASKNVVTPLLLAPSDTPHMRHGHDPFDLNHSRCQILRFFWSWSANFSGGKKKTRGPGDEDGSQRDSGLAGTKEWCQNMSKLYETKACRRTALFNFKLLLIMQHIVFYPRTSRG